MAVKFQHRCEICRGYIALTATGKRWLLLVHSPWRRRGTMGYTHWLCEDCIKLFNTKNWPKTRRALKELRET